MNSPVRFLSFLCLILVVCTGLSGQAWDPLRAARGWARVDRDGSIAFYDPERRKIMSWLRTAGVLGEINVSGLPQALWYWRMAEGSVDDDEDISGRPQPPDMWALDASLNAWVVTGQWLQHVSKDGKVVNLRLPGEVGDLDWDAQGLYLSYRCAEPFIEKRSITDGRVLWSFGPGRCKPSSTVRNQIAVTEDKTLILGYADGFQLDMIDGTSGKAKGRIAFACRGRSLPARIPGKAPAGALAWWLNRGIVLQAVPAAQVPSLGLSGLLLVREDLATATLDFTPTGLSIHHTLVGMVDSEAVFVAPDGGLVFIPISPN